MASWWKGRRRVRLDEPWSRCMCTRESSAWQCCDSIYQNRRPSQARVRVKATSVDILMWNIESMLRGRRLEVISVGMGRWLHNAVRCAKSARNMANEIRYVWCRWVRRLKLWLKMGFIFSKSDWTAFYRSPTLVPALQPCIMTKPFSFFFPFRD